MLTPFPDFAIKTVKSLYSTLFKDLQELAIGWKSLEKIGVVGETLKTLYHKRKHGRRSNQDKNHARSPRGRFI